MSVKKVLPTVCPSCGGHTQVHSLHCSECDTTITGAYNIPPIMQLNAEDEGHRQCILVTNNENNIKSR